MGDWESWSKEALIHRVRELEGRLANAVTVSDPPIAAGIPSVAADASEPPNPPEGAGSRRKSGFKPNNVANARSFDFSKHPCRPIALKFAYLGWNYHGLATQGVPSASDFSNSTGEPGGVETVEGHLIRALLTAKLIPDWRKCGWS
ncbi:hypothetical protein HK101_005778, partial [Irineochytrium annulatum]